MPTLNRFQYAILSIIKLENSCALSLFFTKYDKEEAVQTFIRFLPQLIAGDTSAYLTIQTHLPKLKELTAQLPETNLKTNSLSQFLQTIEDLINVIARGAAFAPLDSNQQIAIDCLTSKGFIQFLADNHFLFHHDNDDTRDILNEIQHTANTGELRESELMNKIYYAYYGIASSSVPNQSAPIRSRTLNYVLHTLLATFLKPTPFNRFLGFFTGIITGGILKPLAHNPLYHFLMLFRSSEKKHHLLAILCFPGLPFYLGWLDCFNGTYNGYRSLIYNLNYLSKRHHNGIALLSLLVLNAAVAASLLALFFPPVIPLLITFFPILANLSLPFIVTTVGLATVVSLTTLAAIGVTIHSFFAPRKKQKQIALQQNVVPEQSDRKEDELELALRALGNSLAEYQPVLTPGDQTSTTPLPRNNGSQNVVDSAELATQQQLRR